MRVLFAYLFLNAFAQGQGVLIDRIAIVVGQAIIKDSDIDRAIRVTEFLNHEPLNIGSAERKKAANQLLDQIFLREEIRAGSYAYAAQQESNRQLEALMSQRFHGTTQLQNELKRYGLDEATLQIDFRWQLTVLSFIDARFKPAVVISDEAVENYYRQHASTLRQENPTASVEELRAHSRDALTEEEVNRLFFAWLDERRKAAKINYHEDGLA